MHEFALAPAVIDGKGGIGKSSIASVLALVLAEGGLRTGLLDLDVSTPFRFCSAFLIVIANARDEVGAVPLLRDLRDLRVKPADPALRPLRRVVVDTSVMCAVYKGAPGEFGVGCARATGRWQATLGEGRGLNSNPTSV